MTSLAAEFGEAADELLRGQMARARTREELDGAGWSDSLWTSISDAGWLGIMLPESLGGMGLGIPEVSELFVAAGRHLLPVPLFDNAVAVPLLLSAAGSSDRVLNLIASRKRVSLVDVAALGQPANRAHLSPQIRDGRLHGTVDLVRFAQTADHLLVISGDPSVPVGLVDVEDDGVEICGLRSFDPAVVYAQVHFSAAPVVPVVDDESTPDRSMTARIADMRSLARLLVAFEMSGTSRYLLDSAVQYAKEREQFDRPIGAFQSIQHLLAHLATKQITLEASCEQSLASWDAGSPARHMAAATTKAIAAEVGRAVGEGALQVHGGIAFTEEFPLHRWHRHVLSLQGLYGDSKQIYSELGGILLEDETAPW